MESRIKVIIDMREEELWDKCEPYVNAPESEWSVEKAALDIGDIAFYHGEKLCLILERKTAEDMGASQKDGRYREQRARLQALRGSGVAIGYMVEAPIWSPTLTRTWCRGTFHEIHLQQAIARLQLRYMIPVFLTHSISDTFQWIRRFAKMLATDADVFTNGVATTVCEAAAVYKEAIHVKKAQNKTPESILYSLLLSIPGVGRNAATAIAEKANNTFPTLYAMTQEELYEIQIGKRKIQHSVANTIYDTLHHCGSSSVLVESGL